MFEVLVASGPRHASGRAWPAGAVSAVLHGGLVTLAVLATRHPAALPGLLPPTPIPVVWDRPSRPPRPAPGPRPLPGPSPVALPGSLALPNVILPPTDPPPGLNVPWTDPLPGPPGPPAGPDLSAGSGAPPVDARVVDEPPILLWHPPLTYPELLRQAGIEGAVTVEAVLDTTGHVEPGSLRALGGANELFAREALAVVASSRYRPGRMGARAVRVRVRVPVTFTLRSGAR